MATRVGDGNGSGDVTVEEIIILVNIDVGVDGRAALDAVPDSGSNALAYPPLELRQRPPAERQLHLPIGGD